MLEKTPSSPSLDIIPKLGGQMKPIITKQENSKFERINFIALKLRERPHTIKELTAMLGVTSKTIQRDLYDTLREYGAVKKGHYWSLNDEDASDGLDGDDRVVLNILDNVAKNMGSNFYSKAHVLLEQISQQLNHPILTNINNEKLSEDDLVNFQTLEDAIREKAEITCTYNGFEFLVKPLKLALFEGFWYLLLLDSKKGNKFKKFHLKSIKDIKHSGDKFELSSELDERVKAMNSAWANLEAPKTARLLLAPEVAKYFERKPHAKQRITGQDSDGSVEIEIEFTHIMEIKPLIYYYLPFIKVLEPKELANKIRDEVGSYFKEIDI